MPLFQGLEQFPTQFYALNPDPNINFQMNRCLTWAGLECLPELQQAGPRIRNFADWKREMLGLAGQAERQRRVSAAAYYYRAAEFFMTPGDPDKLRAYESFLRLIQAAYPVDPDCRLEVPYEGGRLPVLRLPAARPRGTLVVHGGFDSFIEELYPAMSFFQEYGYDLVVFEGPGQGAPLKKHHLPMTHAWEKPVAAVLDALQLKDVTLLGMSLGGCLATRAAAFEPRIRGVIAFDVMYSFFDCLLSRRPQAQAPIKLLLKLRAAPALNALARRMMDTDLLAHWGIHHGMYVMGCRTPFEFFGKLTRYTTRGISDRVTQDYLLLAGAEDHFIPLTQFHQQARALTQVRSFTGRIFTAAEQAQSHCQVGNIGLALQVMLGWLDQFAAQTPA